jgi:hypothetical protein
LPKTVPENKQQEALVWNFESIDTMKYSRDVAREKLSSPSFDTVIEEQVKNIADTGATHIAIATPYDEEFVPFLTRWVTIARSHGLKIWFRGNFSGWEGWFNYPKITREEHLAKTKDFILKHSGLFSDGDVFTACPECENGGPGDPRQTGDIEGHRKFLIDEYSVTKQAFKATGKKVISNYLSMNGDVARAVMDKETTRQLDGVVTIDHYVLSPEKLASDIEEIHMLSGGKIVLGEFGAPILDIHGNMTEDEQAKWIQDVFSKLMQNPNVIGVNYWANMGSSTSLWRDDGGAKKAVETVTTAYKTRVINRTVR